MKDREKTRRRLMNRLDGLRKGIDKLQEAISKFQKSEDILKDVLIFSNKAVFKREIQDIHKIIDDSLNTYKDKCENININKLFGDIPQIYIDEKQVRFAIDNLISNAIDAMPDAGALTIITNVDSLSGKNHVTIKVIDTGGG